MTVISIPPKQRKTAFYFGENIVTTSLIKKICQNTKTVIIMDLYFDNPSIQSMAAELNASLFTLEGGESAKTQKKKQEVEAFLFKEKCGKDTTLIALGGGTITDLVAFIASTYMRGIRLILIPTTLLAMVDAAIGGKTSINTPFGKNLLGSYYPPDAILCDLRFLKTLPSMEWQNGLAEILKIGLISDDSLCIEPQTKDTILKAILQKIKIVMEDPYDQGFRKTLNFGHTIGHALETLSKYKIPHGKAVALGCLAEAHLSMNLGFLNPKDFEKIKKMYLSFSLKIPRNCSSKKLIETMRIDKKNQNGNVHCVLIDQIGHAIEFEGKYTRAISEEELIPTLSWIKSY